MNAWSNYVGAEFPAEWEEILWRRVRFYQLLDEMDRRELKSYIRWFIASKEFEGCDGLIIIDEIRVTVAAQACLLLLHRETPCYERLRLIRVYPGAEFAVSSEKTLSGEFWQQGIILLAWDSVRGGAVNSLDGENITLHEFAHQLDFEDGKLDGIPLIGRAMPASDVSRKYTSWARILLTEYEEFRIAVEQGVKTLMDEYGATDPAEFFAVATECFFEKPVRLQKTQPALYGALREFYKQDPAMWNYPGKG